MIAWRRKPEQNSMLAMMMMMGLPSISLNTDLKLFHRSDSVDDAFEYITRSLVELEESGAVGSR